MFGKIFGGPSALNTVYIQGSTNGTIGMPVPSRVLIGSANGTNTADHWLPVLLTT